MKKSVLWSILSIMGVFALSVFAFNVSAAEVHTVTAVLSSWPDYGLAAAGMAFAGIGDIDLIGKQVDRIENSLKEFAERAQGEIKQNGTLATETKNALDAFGEKQREIADRLLLIEQKNASSGGENNVNNSWGDQFIKSAQYENFVSGNTQKARFEVQNNTLTGSDTTVSPDRKPGVVPGAYAPLMLESLFPSAPTSSNAVEFTKESSFTNSAAETAEGTAKPESSLTFDLVNMPISTVAHWIKISKQLAADASALAAYVNNRMVYGVNRRVETQLAVGNGTAPNISGIFDTGNYTAHGLANAALGSSLKKLVLIRKIMATMRIAGYVPDAILVNPADLAEIDNELMTSTATGFSGLTIDGAGVTRFRGVPFVDSVGVAADTFAVGAFAQAGTIYNRQGVMVEMSESDSDNFTKNLITLRAERRLALAIEIPGAIIGGDLTPA